MTSINGVVFISTIGSLEPLFGALIAMVLLSNPSCQVT